MDVVLHPLSSGHASVSEAELDDLPVALKLEISVVRCDDKRYSQNKALVFFASECCAAPSFAADPC